MLILGRFSFVFGLVLVGVVCLGFAFFGPAGISVVLGRLVFLLFGTRVSIFCFTLLVFWLALFLDFRWVVFWWDCPPVFGRFKKGFAYFELVWKWIFLIDWIVLVLCNFCVIGSFLVLGGFSVFGRGS